MSALPLHAHSEVVGCVGPREGPEVVDRAVREPCTHVRPVFARFIITRPKPSLTPALGQSSTVIGQSKFHDRSEPPFNLPADLYHLKELRKILRQRLPLLVRHKPSKGGSVLASPLCAVSSVGQTPNLRPTPTRDVFYIADRIHRPHVNRGIDTGRSGKRVYANLPGGHRSLLRTIAAPDLGR